MKVCAITNRKCYRWKNGDTTLFCDTCPIAEAHETAVKMYAIHTTVQMNTMVSLTFDKERDARS